MQNLGAQVHVTHESNEGMTFSLTSGKQLIELCTFSAHVAAGEGQTTLQVGGLETYRTSQTKLYMLIPTGPKSIAGFAPYKSFLQEVSDDLARRTAWDKFRSVLAFLNKSDERDNYADNHHQDSYQHESSCTNICAIHFLVGIH